jgi:hypothetical protein
MGCGIAPPGLIHCRARRRLRHTGRQIAAEVGVSPATVSRVLRRLRLNRLSASELAAPVRRYEREHFGELIHIDIKKLGKFNRIGHRITGDRTGPEHPRGVGWEYLHLAIDDHSRLAYSEILPDEKRRSRVRFLLDALRFFRAHGVGVQRVMTEGPSSAHIVTPSSCACSTSSTCAPSHTDQPRVGFRIGRRYEAADLRENP